MFMSNILLPASKPGDRYGFYEIGNLKTYSKIELIHNHYRLPQKWKYNYNDLFFSRYNWTIEPKETIDTLYRKRAEQLRQQYDYLILYYSGGHDSSNILDAFLKNNIPLDEICIFYSDKDGVSNQYKELSTITHLKIKWLKSNFPKLKIRKLNYAEYFLKWNHIIKNTMPEANLLDMFGSLLTINRLILSMAHVLIDDWKKILKKGKKLAWISGIDKPMIRYIDKKWIFNFHDACIHCMIPPFRQIIDDGTIGAYEFFYWAPTDECAKIIIKQCHLLKNAYNTQAILDFSKIPGAKIFKPGYGWEIDRLSNGFTSTIYPREKFSKEIYYNEKNSQFVWGDRDQWFFNSNHEGSQVHWDLYLGTKSKLYDHFHAWYNDGASIDRGFKNSISLNYVI
jgi:hypothetical protein